MSEGLLGALIVGLLSFIGVLISLRQHRIQSAIERNFLVKHQAILSASDAVTRFIQYYVSFPDRELSKNGEVPYEISELGLALNRLHFYCDQDTIKQCVRMGEQLSMAYLNVSRVKINAVIISEKILSIEYQIKSLKEINQVIQQEILSILNAGGDPSLLVSKYKLSEENYKRMAKFEKEKSDLFIEKYRVTEGCRDIVIEGLQDVYQAVRGVLLLARKELSLPIEEHIYENLMSESTNKAVSSIKNFHQEIRSQVKAELEKDKNN